MQSGRNRAKCRPRAQGSTLRRRTGARTSPKGAAQHSQATKRGENVAQGCRPALTGNRKGHKRRPRVPPGTHRRQKEPETLPKGVARHSQATKRGKKRCPRVPPGTHRQRKGARMSPKGAGPHSEATNMKEFVASGCRASHSALISLNIFCQAPIAKSA